MIEFEFNDGGRLDAGYKGVSGDCAVRAVAIVTGQPYRDVYDAFAAAYAAHGYSTSGNASRVNTQQRQAKAEGRWLRPVKTIQQEVYRQFGFEKVTLPDGPCPTFSEALAEHGPCMVTTTKHIAALRDSALHDVFDGRTYCGLAYGMSECEQRKARSIWVRRAFVSPLPDSARLGHRASAEPSEARQLESTEKIEIAVSDYREDVLAEQQRLEGIETGNQDRQDCIARRLSLLQKLDTALDELEDLKNEWDRHEVV